MSEQDTTSEVQRIMAALSRPFDAREIRWKPVTVSGNRALAIAYLTAEAVMGRLDEVLGADGWEDEYQCVQDGCVVCKLRCRIAGQWLTKMDVGCPSEQPDKGDRLKASFSDALKRTAVKLGIGRYLRKLPPHWADFDPVKKQFIRTPTLPAAAAPAAPAKPRPAAPPAVPPAQPPVKTTPSPKQQEPAPLQGGNGEALSAYQQTMAAIKGFTSMDAVVRFRRTTNTTQFTDDEWASIGKACVAKTAEVIGTLDNLAVLAKCEDLYRQIGFSEPQVAWLDRQTAARAQQLPQEQGAA